MSENKYINQVCVKCGRLRQVDPEQRIIRCPYCYYEFNREAERAFLLEEELFELESAGIFTREYKKRLALFAIAALFLIFWFGMVVFYWLLLPLLVVSVHVALKVRRFYFSGRLKELRYNLKQLQKKHK